jgi:Tfp pilus assembly protein PilN
MMRPINLLPPEAAQRAAARRARLGFALLAVVWLALLFLGFLFFSGRADSREEERDTQVALNDGIRSEIAALGPVAELARERDVRSDAIETALEIDVAWGRLLNDLARVIPDRVWLDSFSANVQVDEESVGFGTVQMSGIAFDYPDTASWLRTLDSDQWPAIGAGWVLNTASEQVVEGVNAVSFSSAGTITQNALSDRAVERIPEVPE